MAKHKIQHYVPRCHFKPFSMDGEGKAICLFNLKSGQMVENAPVRHQCARDYYYGPDGKLEAALQPIEGQYSNLVRSLPHESSRMPQETLAFLRDFALLQSLRTQTVHERIALVDKAIIDLVARKSPNSLSEVALDERSVIHRAMSAFEHFRENIQDLRTCIVLNDTVVQFVTSDDPAIQTNRFHFQKLKRKTFGLGSSGALLLMPLTTRHLLLSYDPHTYMLPSIEGSIVKATDPADIRALNSMQFICAGSNVYFRDWNSRDSVARDAAAAMPHRPERWNTVSFLIVDRETPNGVHYRRGTDEELIAAKETMTFNQAIYPEPPVWFSKLKWHPKPRVVDTRSGAGVLRPTASALRDRHP